MWSSNRRRAETHGANKPCTATQGAGVHHRNTLGVKKLACYGWSCTHSHLVCFTQVHLGPVRLYEVTWWQTMGGMEVKQSVDCKLNPQWCPSHPCLGAQGSINSLGLSGSVSPVSQHTASWCRGLLTDMTFHATKHNFRTNNSFIYKCIHPLSILFCHRRF